MVMKVEPSSAAKTINSTANSSAWPLRREAMRRVALQVLAGDEMKALREGEVDGFIKDLEWENNRVLCGAKIVRRSVLPIMPQYRQNLTLCRTVPARKGR